MGRAGEKTACRVDCMMFFFHKRDETKKPFVILRAETKDRAQKKLVQILSGVEYKGTWEVSIVPKGERKELMRRFKLNQLYETDVATEKDLLNVSTEDYGTNVINQVSI